MENKLMEITSQNELQEQYLSPDQRLQMLMEHRSMIKKAMQMEMWKDGEHYGQIEGCGNKKVLLLPGANVLSSLFHFAPRHEVTIRELDKDHREYDVTTYLHDLNGRMLGTGVGICSTKESKYRYNWENTGNPVPKDYWKTRDTDLLGGNQYIAKKKGQEWFIFEKVERVDIADLYNTVKKMAKKRAFVDAVLTVTGVTDIFTQDLEDMPDFIMKKPDTDITEAEYENESEPDWQKVYQSLIDMKYEEVNNILPEHLRFDNYPHYRNAVKLYINPKYNKKFIDKLRKSINNLPASFAKHYEETNAKSGKEFVLEETNEKPSNFESLIKIIDTYNRTVNQRIKAKPAMNTETIVGLIGKDSLESSPIPETNEEIEEFLNLICRDLEGKLKKEGKNTIIMI